MYENLNLFAKQHPEKTPLPALPAGVSFEEIDGENVIVVEKDGKKVIYSVEGPGLTCKPLLSDRPSEDEEDEFLEKAQEAYGIWRRKIN